MHALLHRLVTVSAVFLLGSGMPSPEISPLKTDINAYIQCKPVTDRSCARFFNMREEDAWYARFPNTRGLSLNRSLKEFSDFSWLLNQNNYCSSMLYTLLCFHYFSPCSPSLENPEIIALPCREVCREATEACLPIARAIHGDGVNIPSHLDCTNFERGNDGAGNHVTGSADSTVVLACPNSTIHVDFSPPLGKLAYDVVESAGNLEVCLVLANVGSYDVNSNLNTPVSVRLSTIPFNSTLYEQATPGVDYTPLSTTLVFPVRSNKGRRVCANVPITGNREINSDRSFGLKAEILSPSSASFGGSAQSSTGVIEAVIVDDDDIRVGFVLPAGRLMYESQEDIGYVEICLMLVSEIVLRTPVSVTLTPVETTFTIFARAEPELDYTVVPASVEFPANSEVGHRACANVSISADGLVEADESFSILTTISSPDSVQLVSEHQPSAIVEVIIRDDDACVVPMGHCRRNCDTRDNASRGIFKHNCFVYAAHVQMIRQRNLQGCSALDVTVLECWELQPGVCVANGTRVSIPSCHNCEHNVTAGGEYLIAGLQDVTAGMFLPNYKKGGLIGEWNDRKYSSMSEWVQAGIDFKSSNVDSECEL